MIKITARVEGMMCGMCEAHVQDSVRRAFDIRKVTASHGKNQLVILTETDIAEEDLKKVVDETGYEISDIRKEPYEKKGFFDFLRKK